MKLDVRTPEGKPVERHDANRRIGAALWIVPRYRVTAEDEHTGLGSTLDVAYDAVEGRFVVREAGVYSLSGGEITGTELRRVRLAEIVQAASPQCVAFALDDEDLFVTAAELAESEGRMLPTWLTDTLAAAPGLGSLSESARVEAREARLDAVQLVYGVAVLTGQPPAKAIERELNVAPRTAAQWIRAARDAGRLEGLGYPIGRPARR